MLQVDPGQLRFLASRMAAGSDEIARLSNRLESVTQSVHQPGVWQGEGANAFILRAEHLQDQLKKMGQVLHEVAPILSTLAYRMEGILQKKHELQQLEQRRNSLHVGLDLSADAEIASLDARIGWLVAEIESESLYADAAASTGLRALQVMEMTSDFLESIAPYVKAVDAEIADQWEEHTKPFLKSVLNGIEEFLDIPEMVEAWGVMTDSSRPWTERVHAATTIILDAALDISMFFGIGDVAKAADLLVKFGSKYGKKLLEKEGRKEIAKALSDGAGKLKQGAVDVADGVRGGVEKLARLSRGMPGDVALATTSGSVRSVGFAIPKGGKIVRFATISSEVAAYIKQKGKLRNDHLKNEKHPVTDVPFDEHGFPIFESKYDMQLDPEDYVKSRDTHFDRANKDLYEEIQKNPKLAEEIGLTEEDIEDLEERETPAKFTWHHHQEPGKMQLVDKEKHKKTGHNGGFDIWGPSISKKK